MSVELERLVRADLESLDGHGEALCNLVFDAWLASDPATKRCFEQNSFSSKREMLDSTLISVYDLPEGASWLKWNLVAYGARHSGVYLVDDGMYAEYIDAVALRLRRRRRRGRGSRVARRT